MDYQPVIWESVSSFASPISSSITRVNPVDVNNAGLPGAQFVINGVTYLVFAEANGLVLYNATTQSMPWKLYSGLESDSVTNMFFNSNNTGVARIYWNRTDGISFRLSIDEGGISFYKQVNGGSWTKIWTK